MYQIRSSSVRTEFINGATEMCPIVGRKYTVTHSDETGEIFVTIGFEYANNKINENRDELLLAICNPNNELTLSGMVLVDDSSKEWNSKLRNKIFMEELPNALRAVRYADRKLYESIPVLDKVPINIWFQSEKEQYNKVYNFGTMEEYIME